MFAPSAILAPLADPNIALLVLFLGLLGVYTEANLPGKVLPGAISLLMVLVALFALGQQPLHLASALLALVGIALLLLEVKLLTRGVLALCGILALGYGTLTLSANPAEQVHPLAAITLTLVFALLTLLLARIALRARTGKFRLGADALTGLTATALEPLTPTGRVLVAGEIWQATSTEPAEKDATVRVTGGNQYQLTVQPIPQHL